MRSVNRAAAVALAAAALGSGCSAEKSGTPSTTGSAVSPTATATTNGAPKTEFAKKADSICEKWQSKIDAIPPPSDPTELAPTMKKTIPLTENEVADLRKLEPPPNRSATVSNLIGALDRIVAALKQYVKAESANDGDTAQLALVDADEQTTHARRLASELGLSVCGAKR